MKTFNRLPDDNFYEDINPYLKAYLYETWIFEQEEEAELRRREIIFLGSFSNPEAARRIAKSEEPDHESSDEEFDKAAEGVREKILEADSNKGKKKRKKRKVLD